MLASAHYSSAMEQERRAPINTIQAAREPLHARQSVDVAHLADTSIRVIDLHETIQRALRSAARAASGHPVNGEPDELSRKALAVVCELARREQLRIEQLLVMLKDAWRHLPEVQSVSRKDADITLECVVTYCIKEFYRPSRRS